MSQPLPFCPFRYALTVSYLGSRYYGSQRLSARGKLGDLETIQEALEQALEKFLPKQKIALTAGSRTDKGVHALMNVYTLPLMDYKVPTARIKEEVNLSLMKKKHNIILKDVLLVPSTFHPRKSCVSREYVYRVAVMKNHKTNKFLGSHKPLNLFHLLPITELERCLPVPYLDVEKAQDIVEMLRGEHDFRAFCFSPKIDDKTIRTLEISLALEDRILFEDEHIHPFDIYQFRFKSHSFLHNQVRRTIGAILTYASYSKTTKDKLKSLLENPDQNWPANFLIAEPFGLFLKKLNYNNSAFIGSKRTYDDDPDEDVDPHEVEGSSHEILSDDQTLLDAKNESGNVNNEDYLRLLNKNTVIVQNNRSATQTP